MAFRFEELKVWHLALRLCKKLILVSFQKGFFIAQTRKYINEIDFKKYYDEYEVLCKMIEKRGKLKK
ncbi:MAG: hypothetical protein IPL50_07940 [Chitinophagaceae bacterium]|nr:hypothetical protein [Chitinophagaceae bacterium]